MCRIKHKLRNKIIKIRNTYVINKVKTQKF